MSNVLIATTLVIAALQASYAQNCQPLDVGCCISIKTELHLRDMRTLYDWTNDHWVYMAQNTQADKSHQWKVRAKEGNNIFQFESVAFPGRCFCEKSHFSTNYGSGCECKSQEPVQMWELGGIEKGNSEVTFKRPKYEYYLYPCSDGKCVKVHWKRYEWLIQKC
uniref:Hypothetical secreted simulium-specific salivary protein n=1 Tax=Simulium guianense TaxID=445764 RepID=F5GTU7_SIMGU